jgi:6-phosphogluconolactonase (cycloisomerase 2 family)
MNRRTGLTIAMAWCTVACGASTPTETSPRAGDTLTPSPTPFVFHLRENDTFDYSLWTFRSDPRTGTLIPRSETKLGLNARGYAVHPTQPFVYVRAYASSGSSDTVLRAFRVESDGTLGSVSDLAVPPTVGWVVSLSFDATGRRLYLIGRGAVAMCSLGPGGIPRLEATDLFPGSRVYAAAFSSSHAYVAATTVRNNTATSAIRVYRLDESGRPAAEQQSVAGSVRETDNGAFTSAVGSLVSSGRQLLVAFGVIEPSGNEVGIQPYAIDATTGLLKPVPGAPFVGSVSETSYPDFSGLEPRNFVIHPTGRFVYVNETVQISNRLPSHVQEDSVDSVLTAYRFDAAIGTVARAPGSSVSTGPLGETLEMSPDGSFLYVGRLGWSARDSVLGFRIDAEAGALTPVGSAFTFPR